jgi:hypothetical protein
VRGAKTAVGGEGAGARNQRSAERAQERETTGRRRERRCAKPTVDGEGTGARKQRLTTSARVRETSGRRRGRGGRKQRSAARARGAKTAVGGAGEGAVSPNPFRRGL